MAVRHSPDEISVYVMVPVTVSEKKWRAAFRAKGVDMTGIVTAAHVNNFLRASIQQIVQQMGVVPEKKGK